MYNTAFIEEFIPKIKKLLNKHNNYTNETSIFNDYTSIYKIYESLIHIKILINNKVIEDAIDSVIDILYEKRTFRDFIIYLLNLTLSSRMYIHNTSYVELENEKIKMVIKSIIQKMDIPNNNNNNNNNTSVVYPISDFIRNNSIQQIMSFLNNIHNISNLDKSINKNIIIKSTLNLLTIILNNLPNKNFFSVNKISLITLQQTIVLLSIILVRL